MGSRRPLTLLAKATGPDLMTLMIAGGGAGLLCRHGGSGRIRSLGRRHTPPHHLAEVSAPRMHNTGSTAVTSGAPACSGPQGRGESSALAVPADHRIPIRRSDAPCVKTYTRGPAEKARAIAADPSEVDRVAEAFMAKAYAMTSIGPREARAARWEEIAGTMSPDPYA